MYISTSFNTHVGIVQILIRIGLNLMHHDMIRSQHELWGWETFFDSLESFIEVADRYLGNCTDRYACYAAESMEMCMQYVYQLKEHIQGHMTAISQPNIVILNYYLSEMESLISSLKEWQRYTEVRERLTK